MVRGAMFFVALLIFSSDSWATVYKCKGPDGQMLFQQVPCKGEGGAIELHESVKVTKSVRQDCSEATSLAIDLYRASLNGVRGEDLIGRYREDPDATKIMSIVLPRQRVGESLSSVLKVVENECQAGNIRIGRQQRVMREIDNLSGEMRAIPREAVKERKQETARQDSLEMQAKCDEYQREIHELQEESAVADRHADLVFRINKLKAESRKYCINQQ